MKRKLTPKQVIGIVVGIIVAVVVLAATSGGSSQRSVRPAHPAAHSLQVKCEREQKPLEALDNVHECEDRAKIVAEHEAEAEAAIHNALSPISQHESEVESRAVEAKQHAAAAAHESAVRAHEKSEAVEQRTDGLTREEAMQSARHGFTEQEAIRIAISCKGAGYDYTRMECR